MFKPHCPRLSRTSLSIFPQLMKFIIVDVVQDFMSSLTCEDGTIVPFHRFEDHRFPDLIISLSISSSWPKAVIIGIYSLAILSVFNHACAVEIPGNILAFRNFFFVEWTNANKHTNCIATCTREVKCIISIIHFSQQLLFCVGCF